MKIQIVSVSVKQTARVLAVLYMVISVPAFAGLALASMSQGSFVGVFAALIIAPLLYGAFVFLCTGLVAWLYNFVAKHYGGLEYSIEEMSGGTGKV